MVDGKCDFLIKNIVEASAKKKPVMKKEEVEQVTYVKKDGYGEVRIGQILNLNKF